jgi:hypothetical protein
MAAVVMAAGIRLGFAGGQTQGQGQGQAEYRGYNYGFHRSLLLWLCGGLLLMLLVWPGLEWRSN